MTAGTEVTPERLASPQETSCCIVGGGPAGMVLAVLRMLLSVPILRDLPARMIAFGPRRARLQE